MQNNSTYSKLQAASERKSQALARFNEIHAAINAVSSRRVPASEFAAVALAELQRQAAAINAEALSRISIGSLAKNLAPVHSAGGILGDGRVRIRTSKPERIDWFPAVAAEGSSLAMMLAVGAIDADTLTGWLEGLATQVGCPEAPALTSAEVAAESADLAAKLQAATDEFTQASSDIRELSALLSAEAEAGPIARPPVEPVVSAPVSRVQSGPIYIDAA